MKSLHTKYIILREIVTLMGLFEYVAAGLGIFFVGAKEYQSSAVFLTLMAISYYISTKLGYRVFEILVQLQSHKEAE